MDELSADTKRALLSDVLEERLGAARRLVAMQLSKDAVPFLESVLQKESNNWIKGAVAQALVRIAQASSITSALPDDDQVDAAEDDLRPVVEWITTILHEIGNRIATVELSSRNEIDEYDTSRSKLGIERLKNSVAALQTIKNVTREPKYQDFDLAALMSEIRDAFPDSRIILGGNSPFWIRSDRSLIELILVNAIRNAAEAIVITEDPDCQEIMVTWGLSNRAYFISVLDRGVGLQGDLDLFAFGASNKEGHSGIGLALVSRACSSLGGDVQLTPRSEKGVEFFLRIPRKS